MTRPCKGDIIFIVKANRVFTIALATVCGAAIISVGNAFGAEEVKDAYYPLEFNKELTEQFGDTPIRDFAVYGDTLAFAHSNFVYVLYTDSDNNERQMQPYQHTSGITSIEYADDGKLYFKDATETTYLYSTATKTASEQSYDFVNLPTYNLIVTASVSYTLNKETGDLSYGNDGVWKTVKASGEDDGAFSLLKQCGDKIYSVKDNLPYSVEGDVATKIDDLKYTNFDEAKRLPTGNAKQKLQTLNDKVTVCEIMDNRFYTKLNDVEIGERFDTDVTARANGNITCLLLSKIGSDEKTAIVAIGNDLYITATDNLTNFSEMQSNADGKTYYAIIDADVYSSPFMSECTKIKDTSLKSGKDHAVTVIERYEHIVLRDKKFCKISYEEDGQIKTGFVAANFLIEHKFEADDNKPQNKGEDKFSYDTNVPTVLLAILIVGLVIIAAMYLFLVFTKKNGTPKVKKEKKKKIVEQAAPPDDEYDE